MVDSCSSVWSWVGVLCHCSSLGQIDDTSVMSIPFFHLKFSIQNQVPQHNQSCHFQDNARIKVLQPLKVKFNIPHFKMNRDSIESQREDVLFSNTIPTNSGIATESQVRYDE